MPGAARWLQLVLCAAFTGLSVAQPVPQAVEDAGARFNNRTGINGSAFGGAPAPALAPLCSCDKAKAVPAATPAVPSCFVSKVSVRQDHAGGTGPRGDAGGVSLADVTAIYGSDVLSEAQRQAVSLARVADTSFMCLDDRVSEPTLATPGGDLGEFVLGLASYLMERDPSGQTKPTQEVVSTLLQKYVETIPDSRPLVHCTDDRAVRHLEAELPAENLDLNAPPVGAKQEGLMERLMEVENQGDSHFRLMLKRPEWYQLDPSLVPMVLRAFYSLLWEQNQNFRSPLHHSPKLKLQVLVGQSDPQAFVEVSSTDLCHDSGVAPRLQPHRGARSLLISHLDAVSQRRQELASFFSRIANSSPRKIDRDKLHQRLDRHGWLALEATGRRIAGDLPFYTLTYT